MKFVIVIILLITFQYQSSAQISNQSKSLLMLLLDADGIKNDIQINNYINRYQDLLFDIKNEIDDEQKVYKIHNIIFNTLHDDYFKKYKNEAYFNKLLTGKEFNCVTAVLLYNLLCNDLGLAITLYESPFHVYLTAQIPNSNPILIELTDPVDGFNSKLDNGDYIEPLLEYKIITPEELEDKGERQIIREFISKTHEINTNELISIYYTNLASFYLEKDSTFKAYEFVKKAVQLSSDSLRILSHNYIWYLHTSSLESNTNSYNSFLLENLDSIPKSNDFYDQMIFSTAKAIDLNNEKNDFDNAEIVYRKLVSVLPPEKLLDQNLARLEIAIKTEKVRNKVIRGNYDEAFHIASELRHKYKDNDKILDLYLFSGNNYMQNLGMTRMNEELLAVCDSMILNAPGIKSVEDNYVVACMQSVMNNGMYSLNPEKSKKILFTALERLPDNVTIKNAIGYLFHELAMAEIRNNRYKKAVELLDEGLKYDPDNYELLREIRLTKDLLNKR